MVPIDWFQQYGGLSTSYKEIKTWWNYNKFRSQGAARYGIAANVYNIVTGIQYLGSPASGGVGPNAEAGAGGVFSVVMGMGTASAGADMAIGGTAAAAAWGGLAAATGIGAIIVGGTVVGVAGYRASDAWVNTTPSGAWFTNELGAGLYAAGKFFGNYNFILPFDFWKKAKVQTYEPRHMKYHLPARHLLPHCR